MTQTTGASFAPPPGRRAELLERAYAYVLEHGLAGMSLRPLAAAVGSSPRVLLYLFGSKDGLVLALLERARADELDFLARLRAPGPEPGVAGVVRATWQWLADGRVRSLLTLWVEAYARSLVEPDGPWSGFARDTVRDWLAVLAAAQPPRRRHSAAGAAERSLALSVLRGALLDLLATGETARVSAGVEEHLRLTAHRDSGARRAAALPGAAPDDQAASPAPVTPPADRP